jgi:hypothetical protein
MKGKPGDRQRLLHMVEAINKIQQSLIPYSNNIDI